MSAEKKLMMMFEPFASGSASGGGSSSSRDSRKGLGPPSFISPIQRKSRLVSGCESTNGAMASKEGGNENGKMPGIKGRQVKGDERFFSNCSHSTSSHSKVLHNLVIFLAILMSLTRTVESVPQGTVEKLDSKIKMFLESHCTMQNQTLEQEEFQSFMACGPSHGAGIVKNLGQIQEYKSEDTEQWARATKREIISQCDVWPQDRKCQETTFGLIEKCFEKDQKFIFYFMFALTDVICHGESDLFIRFWQNGGDSCLGNHIKSLKKDFSDCFDSTSSVSNADVYRNIDDVMQCFRSQFDKDCFGDDANQVLNEIMTEIKRVYRETSRSSAKISATAFFPAIFCLLFSTKFLM